jgi:2-dehydro-3-deoxygalactonokinase
MTAQRGRALIGIDWGTTTARAYRFDARGNVVGESSAPLGVQKVEAGRFRAALETLLGGDIPAGSSLLAGGMIGSRQGWVEVPYLDCPADLTAIAAALARVRDTALAIVPGLICRDADGVPDVMRGEETQIVGALEEATSRQAVVLPGTHSKWALAGKSGIETFATFMTGELYAVLREHSILGRLAAEGSDPGAFERGVHSSLGSRVGLLHELFSARTLALTGALASAGVADYLSGLLIGAEVAAGRRWLQSRAAASLRITLVGDAMLCSRYRCAFALAGVDANIGPTDAAARGLWRIAQRARMVPG